MVVYSFQVGGLEPVKEHFDIQRQLGESGLVG